MPRQTVNVRPAASRGAFAARLVGRNKAALFAATAMIAVAACLPQVALAADTTAQSAGSTPTSEVAEVIVTANKRQENVQNVGMSIQAATGDTLTKLGITDASQLVKIVPGFNYTLSETGTPIFSIRGVSYRDFALAGNPAVVTYLDEVPFPYTLQTPGLTLDVQRVEVLKGPQGTLFGDNSTGGAINFIANKPTNTFHDGFDVSYGRFDTLDAQGFISGPITDTLSARLALHVTESGPWQESYTHNAQIGDKNLINGRLTLLWKPTDKLRVTTTFTGFVDRSDTQAAQLYGFAPLSGAADPRLVGTGPLLNAPFLNEGGAGHYPFAPHNDQAADWGTCVNTSPFDPPFNTVPPPYSFSSRPVSATSCTGYRKDDRQYSGALRIEYELPDDMTLTSLSSFEHYDRYEPQDLNGTIYQLYDQIATGHINSIYEELRLAGKINGKGSWLAGANYQHDDTYENYFFSDGDSSLNPLALPIPPYLFYGPTSDSPNKQKNDIYAAYINAEYPILDTLTLQAGWRYTVDDKSFIGCSADSGSGQDAAAVTAIQVIDQLVNGDPISPSVIAPGGCTTLGPGPTFAPGPVRAKLDEHNISWRTGLNWRVTPDNLVYLNVSQGYKAGGFPQVPSVIASQLVPAKQEGLLAYEVGSKSTLFDRKLTLDIAAYYYDYHHKQLLGDLVTILGPLQSLVNVPNSHIAGFEASAVARPIEGLTITPAFNYTFSRIDGCTASEDKVDPNVPGGPGCYNNQYHNFDLFGSVGNFTGESFPNTPQWQADIDAEYDWKLQGDVQAFVGLNLNYQSGTASFFIDKVSTVEPATIMDIRAYTLLDLRAGVSKDDWRLEFWGRNVANTYYWTNAAHVNDALVRFAGMPATFGFTLSYRH